MNIKKIIKRMFMTIIAVIIGLIILVVATINFLPSFGAKATGERLERMQSKRNYKNGRFTNIHTVKEDFTMADYKEIFSKMLKGNPRKNPKEALPIQKWTKEELAALPEDETTLIWFGHSAFFMKMNGKNILLDPMFGAYPSPIQGIGSKRFNDTLPATIDMLPPIDLVVFSHDHYDHLDYESIQDLKDKVAHFLVPLGVGAHLEKWGVAPHKITERYWHESYQFEDITFTCTPSQHFSGRGLSDKQATLWASWAINGGKDKVFFSGDSGYFDGFKEIGEKYGPFDLTLMECGQYDVLWKDIHMMPEETAQAHLDVKGETMMPIHWAGFALANHDWDDSILRVKTACEANNIDMITPMIGRAITVNKPMNTRSWWLEVK